MRRAVGKVVPIRGSRGEGVGMASLCSAVDEKEGTDEGGEVEKKFWALTT